MSASADQPTKLPLYTWTGAFNSDRWLTQLEDSFLRYQNNDSLIPPPRASDLPLLVSTLGITSVLDYGGSNGWTFEYLKRSCNINPDSFFYTIYELPHVCAFFSVIHPIGSPVTYKSSLSDLQNFEVLYSNSVLQYLLDDTELFNVIKRHCPRYILLENFLGGDFHDYYSLQNYYEYQIPVKFRCYSSFLTSVMSLGYTLLLRKVYYEPIRGTITSFNMDNFPDNLRINYGTTLIFERNR
jgi:putative methyltransferase (TIGR04325 family)